MKLYKVSYRKSDYEHAGYEFFRNLRDANAAKKKWGNESNDTAEIELIEVNPTKSGIRNALNKHASHPDNG